MRNVPEKVLARPYTQEGILDLRQSSYGGNAATELGYKHTPPVNHSADWCDATIGFHTNNAELENQRIKHFCRRRNGGLTGLSESFMYEYIFYINVGSSMGKIMDGFALSTGGKQTTHLIL